MTTPKDAWLPVALAWKFVCVGDVFYSPKTDDLWLVTAKEDKGEGRLGITVLHGADAHTVEVGAETEAQVLVTVAERDSGEVCRELLGASLIERTKATT